MVTERDLIRKIDDRLNPDNWKQVVTLAIVNMYWYQTQDEKETRSTFYKNNVGFNAFDAARGSKWAKMVLPTVEGGKLGLIPDDFIYDARDMVMRYRKQIVAIMNSVGALRKAQAASSNKQRESTVDIVDNNNKEQLIEPIPTTKKAPVNTKPVAPEPHKNYIDSFSKEAERKRLELVNSW